MYSVYISIYVLDIYVSIYKVYLYLYLYTWYIYVSIFITYVYIYLIYVSTWGECKTSLYCLESKIFNISEIGMVKDIELSMLSAL